MKRRITKQIINFFAPPSTKSWLRPWDTSHAQDQDTSHAQGPDTSHAQLRPGSASKRLLILFKIMFRIFFANESWLNTVIAATSRVCIRISKIIEVIKHGNNIVCSQKYFLENIMNKKYTFRYYSVCINNPNNTTAKDGQQDNKNNSFYSVVRYYYYY